MPECLREINFTPFDVRSVDKRLRARVGQKRVRIDAWAKEEDVFQWSTSGFAWRDRTIWKVSTGSGFCVAISQQQTYRACVSQTWGEGVKVNFVFDFLFSTRFGRSNCFLFGARFSTDDRERIGLTGRLRAPGRVEQTKNEERPVQCEKVGKEEEEKKKKVMKRHLTRKRWRKECWSVWCVWCVCVCCANERLDEFNYEFRPTNDHFWPRSLERHPIVKTKTAKVVKKVRKRVRTGSEQMWRWPSWINQTD